MLLHVKTVNLFFNELVIEAEEGSMLSECIIIIFLVRMKIDFRSGIGYIPETPSAKGIEKFQTQSAFHWRLYISACGRFLNSALPKQAADSQFYYGRNKVCTNCIFEVFFFGNRKEYVVQAYPGIYIPAWGNELPGIYELSIMV